MRLSYILLVFFLCPWSFLFFSGCWRLSGCRMRSMVVAVAEYVDGGICGSPHRVGVGGTFAGNVVSGAVVGGCAHRGSPAVKFTPLSLAIVLKERGPESWYMARTPSKCFQAPLPKKPSAAYGPKANLSVAGTGDGGCNHFFLLATQNDLHPACGLRARLLFAGCAYGKIAAQGGVELPDFGIEELRGNGVGYLRYWHVCRYEGPHGGCRCRES